MAESPPAPSLGPRLAWWFGLYLAAQLPLLFLLPGDFTFLWSYPIGLGFLFAWGQINTMTYWWPDRPTVFIGCYAFFLFHLWFTCTVGTRRAYRALLISLGLLAAITTLGCYTEIAGKMLFDRPKWQIIQQPPLPYSGK